MTFSAILFENRLKCLFRRLYSRKFCRCHRKTKNIIWIFFIIVKKPNECHAFTIQTDFENMSENKVFRSENNSKTNHDVHLNLLLKKDLICYFILYYKNKNTRKFYSFKIENDIRNSLKFMKSDQTIQKTFSYSFSQTHQHQ